MCVIPSHPSPLIPPHFKTVYGLSDKFVVVHIIEAHSKNEELVIASFHWGLNTYGCPGVAVWNLRLRQEDPELKASLLREVLSLKTGVRPKAQR